MLKNRLTNRLNGPKQRNRCVQIKEVKESYGEKKMNG